MCPCALPSPRPAAHARATYSRFACPAFRSPQVTGVGSRTAPQVAAVTAVHNVGAPVRAHATSCRTSRCP
eukprot:6185606-Pleurochrysis_carterae.AAC.4